MQGYFSNAFPLARLPTLTARLQEVRARGLLADATMQSRPGPLPALRLPLPRPSPPCARPQLGFQRVGAKRRLALHLYSRTTFQSRAISFELTADLD